MTDASLARTRELFNTILGEEGLKFDRDVPGPVSTQEQASSGSGSAADSHKRTFGHPNRLRIATL